MYRLYKGVCQGCGKDPLGSVFHLGHIIPQSHAEEFENWFPGLNVDNLLNLHLLCATCNAKQTNVYIHSPFRLNQLFAQSAAAISRRLSKVAAAHDRQPSIEAVVRQRLLTMGAKAVLSTATVAKVPSTASLFVVRSAALRAGLASNPIASTLTNVQLAAAFAEGVRRMGVPYRLVEYGGGWQSSQLTREQLDELERVDGPGKSSIANGQNARVHVPPLLWASEDVTLVHLTPAEMWAQKTLPTLLRFRAEALAGRTGLYEVEYDSSELPELLGPFEWARAAAPGFCKRQMSPDFASVDAGVNRSGRRLVYEAGLAKLPKNLRASAEQLVKTSERDVGLLAPRLALLRAIDNCLEFGLWAVDCSGGEVDRVNTLQAGARLRFP